MGGIVGRLFREFAVTLSVAILVSMVISLTATPMMCAYLLKPQESHGRLYQTSETGFGWIIDTVWAEPVDRSPLFLRNSYDFAGHDRLHRIPFCSSS